MRTPSSVLIMEKILFVAPSFYNSKGGIGLCLVNYAKHLSPFKIITTSSFESLALNVFVFPWRLLQLFIRLLFDGKIELVHIHGASQGSFYRKMIVFWLAKFLFQKKVIYHIHGGGFQEFYEESGKRWKAVIRWMIEKVDLLICLSEKWKGFFEAEFNVKKVCVLPNVVLPLSPNNEVSYKGRLELLFLGLICKDKGIFDLLEVIHINKQKFRDRLFLRIGGNGEVERLVRYIRQNDLHDLVSFEGWVTGDKKDQLFRSSNVYILPSYYEGLPLSILEAMTYGLPIVASEVGGIPDILNSYTNGLMVEAGNRQEIQNALTALMENPYLISIYSQKSLFGVVDFLPGTVLNQLLDMYASLLGVERKSPEVSADIHKN